MKRTFLATGLAAMLGYCSTPALAQSDDTNGNDTANQPKVTAPADQTNPTDQTSHRNMSNDADQSHDADVASDPAANAQQANAQQPVHTVIQSDGQVKGCGGAAMSPVYMSSRPITRNGAIVSNQRAYSQGPSYLLRHDAQGREFIVVRGQRVYFDTPQSSSPMTASQQSEEDRYSAAYGSEQSHAAADQNATEKATTDSESDNTSADDDARRADAAVDPSRDNVDATAVEADADDTGKPELNIDDREVTDSDVPPLPKSEVPSSDSEAL